MTDHQSTTQAPEASGISSADDLILQIKVRLLGIERPPVWRRLQIPAKTPLDEVHNILAKAFGWVGDQYHLYQFTIGEPWARRVLSGPTPYIEGAISSRELTLGQLMGQGGPGKRGQVIYTYDLGQGWQHELVLEGAVNRRPDTSYPALVAAKGACPPEDCGGPYGYHLLKEAIHDPTHPWHERAYELLGPDFDPAVIGGRWAVGAPWVPDRAGYWL